MMNQNSWTLKISYRYTSPHQKKRRSYRYTINSQYTTKKRAMQAYRATKSTGQSSNISSTTNINNQAPINI